MSEYATTSPVSPEKLEEFSQKTGGGNKVKRKPDDFPNPISVRNATLEPLFDNDDANNNVWIVRGNFPIIPRIMALTATMTIYRDNSTGELTIFNAFRCTDELEQQILQLGPIAHVIKLGQFHGDAEAYYVRAPHFNVKPKLWTLPGGSVAEGTQADEILSDTNLPIAGAKLYNMIPHPFPEGVMTLPIPTGRLLIACDALMHVADLSLVSYMGRLFFYLMGLQMQSQPNVPKPAPLWCQNTVEAMGVTCVRRWYQDIADMEWDTFIGAHGLPAYNVNHKTMMEGIETQISSSNTGGGGVDDENNNG